MKFDFDQPVDRLGGDSMKWNRYAERGILPLWVADMDFVSPPAVIEALQARIEHGVFGYGQMPPELNEVFCARLQRLYGWQVEPRALVWLPGLVCGLHAVCRSVGEPGDAVLTHTPVYPPFLVAPARAGRELQTALMTQAEAGWQLDFEALARAATDRTRLFMLCNPHNPTGRVFSREELHQLAEFCLARDLVICADEIHCDLILDRQVQHVPLAALDERIAQRTITLMAPSKTYNIAGLGCSVAIIPDAGLRRRFKETIAGIVPSVNVLGYTAALAAYRDGDAWLAQLLDYLRANRRLLETRLQTLPGVSAQLPQATYLAWLDTRGTGLAQPAAFFEQAGVGLSDGRDFGLPGFVRLNFGCTRATLNSALERMQAALASL